MKKSLLFIAIIAITATTFAQTVWDFSTLYPLTTGNTTIANQGVKDNIGFFVNPLASTPVTTFTIDFSSKTFAAGGTYAGGALTSRLKLGGKGSDASSSNPNMPTTNYLYFNVTGACTITVFCRSSTSNATDGRTLYITDGTNLLGSFLPPTTSSDAATIVTANYTGGAGVIYIYGYINAFNIYRVEVSANVGTTTVISGIEEIFNDKGITFNGNEVLNSNNRNIEVFNILGKQIGKSTTNFDMTAFPKGIYLVRTEGVNGALKFTK